MSRSTRERTSEEKTAEPESPVSETRIDPAHRVDTASGRPPACSAPDPLLSRNSPAGPLEDPDGVLHRQAAQLAEYLRARQSELDHRQIRLDEQIAQLESETRAAQLWINEREAELDERRRELTDREAEAAQRLDRLAAAERALYRRAGDCPDFSAEKMGLSPSGIPSSQPFLQERRQFHEEMQRRQERIAAAEQHALREVEKKRQALSRRSEHLDRHQEALRALRGQLLQMHRETLEIRLAAEELWIRMAGSAPPAALTLELERIRGQLAEQYRAAGAESAEQKRELETIREELAAQCRAFDAHKKQFERWAATQRQQLEIQAQRLAERERLLAERRLAS